MLLLSLVGLAVAGIFVYVKDVPTAGQFLLSLFSPIAFGVGTFLIVDREIQEKGLTWDSSDGIYPPPPPTKKQFYSPFL